LKQKKSSHAEITSTLMRSNPCSKLQESLSKNNKNFAENNSLSPEPYNSKKTLNLDHSKTPIPTSPLSWKKIPVFTLNSTTSQYLKTIKSNHLWQDTRNSIPLRISTDPIKNEWKFVRSSLNTSSMDYRNSNSMSFNSLKRKLK